MGSNYSTTEFVCLVLSAMVYFGCYQFMNRLGRPTTSEPDGKGALLDSGLDLNMKDGMAEHVKVCLVKNNLHGKTYSVFVIIFFKRLIGQFIMR